MKRDAQSAQGNKGVEPAASLDDLIMDAQATISEPRLKEVKGPQLQKEGGEESRVLFVLLVPSVRQFEKEGGVLKILVMRGYRLLTLNSMAKLKKRGPE